MWLTVPQLARLEGISERAIRKRIANGGYSKMQQVDGLGRGGKSWQISVLDPAVPEHVRASLGIVNDKAKEARQRKEAESVSIAPEQLDEKTARRLRVLKLATDCPPDKQLRDWYTEIAIDEGISVPTIYRWLKEAGDGKVTSDRAPVPVTFEVKSGPVGFSVSSRSFAPLALDYGFMLLAQNPLMDVKNAYLHVCTEAEKQGWDVGSIKSFYRAWAKVPEPIKRTLSAGRRGLELLIKPPITRDMSVYRVYEMLCGDQHIFDYMVLTDDGTPIRPQMFMWGDMRSRYLSGVWPVLGNYDRYAVGFALRESCRWGIPDSLYTDWGRPERSNYVAHLRKQLSGLAIFTESDIDAQGVGHVKAKPRNAQAKPIESWFKNAIEGPLEQMNLPGYCRQDKLDDVRNEHLSKQLREQIRAKKLLSARDFFGVLVGLIQGWNTHKMTDAKIVPEEVFLSGIDRHLHRFDDKTLDFIFLPAARRMVRNSTISMTLDGFGKCNWYAPELSSLCTRGRKETVEVRFNPFDASQIYVLDIQSNELICIAELNNAVNPKDMDNVSIYIKRQNELMKHWLHITKALRKGQTASGMYLYDYAKAVNQIDKQQVQRETLVVDEQEVNRKLIAAAARINIPKAV